MRSLHIRKKIAYFEDKVTYLTELYKVISEEPERIIKKRFIVLFRLIRGRTQEHKKTMCNKNMAILLYIGRQKVQHLIRHDT